MGVRYAPHMPGIANDCAPAALAFVLALGLSACAPAKGPSKETVSLRLQGNLPDATVIIDDQDLGSLAFVQSRGVALPIGVHRISVTAPGYFPWDKAVEAKPGSPLIRLDVALMPVPD
jgi:hypothetical protein